MLSQSLTRLNLGLDNVISYLQANQGFRRLMRLVHKQTEPSLIEAELEVLFDVAPTSSQWSVLDHCTAVGRIYALFEQFTEGQLAEWLEFRTQGYKFADLPERLTQAYATGFSIVLGDIDKTRYKHLKREVMISQYNAALTGSKTYRLNPECIIYDNNNLRWEELNEVYSRAGIENLEAWIAVSPSLARLYNVAKRIPEQVKAQLKNFVQYRNDAAHGAVAVDEILGTEELVSQAEFIRELCASLHDFVNNAATELMMHDRRASQIGVVKEAYSSNVIVANVEGATLELGGFLVVQTDRSLTGARIITIRVDDCEVDKVIVANPREVGLGLDIKANTRARLIIVPEFFEN